MQYRFMVYNQIGTLIGELPQPVSWQLTTARNEVSSLILEYPQNGANVNLLTGAVEVAFEIYVPSTNTYIEPVNCRFLNIRRQIDRANPNSPIRYTMPGIAWVLRKIRMMVRTNIGDDGRRYFNNTTIGEPLTTMVSETQARLNVPRLETWFSANFDSQFEFWDDDSLNIGVALGQDYLGFLDALSRQGMCDWAMSGWSLLVYNVSGAGFGELSRLRRDVHLRPGVDFSEDLVDYTREDIASRLALEGENNSWVTLFDGTADDSWGYWEHYISQPGLNRTADMVTFAQKAISSMRQERAQVVRTVVDADRPWAPLRDYRPGDYITSSAASGTQGDQMRIHQITLSSNPDGTVDTILTLNDIFLDRAIRNERINNGLLAFGGPSIGGGTTGWRWR